MSLLLLFAGGSTPLNATADPAALTITGVDPTVTFAGVNRDVDVGTLTITGVDPTLTIVGVNRTVDVGTLTITGVDPTLTTQVPIVVDAATLTITGITPTAELIGAPPISYGGQTIISTTPTAAIMAEFEAGYVRVVRWVDIYNADNTTLWRSRVAVSDGEVTVDMGRDERRNIDLTLHDPDGDLGYGPGGFWYNKVIKPYRGILLSNGDTFVSPLGEFMPDVITRTRFPYTLKVTGRDFTKKLIKAKLGQTTTFAAGTNVASIIRAVAANGGIAKFNFVTAVGVLGADVTFERNTTRWEICKKLAESINCELFFDAFGYLVLRTFVDPVTAPVAYTFNVNNLADFDRVTDDNELNNDIIVYGDGPDNPLVFAQATNTNPASPTNVNEIGWRTYTYASQFFTNNTQAQAFANSLLKVAGLEQYTMNLDSLVIPWAEAGNAVEVAVPDAATTDPTRFLLSSFGIPLRLGVQRGVAKRITNVG